MRLQILLLGLGFAAGAVLLALAVVLPVFHVVNAVYNGGDGLIPLLIVVLAWLALTVLLRRRRISLK